MKKKFNSLFLVVIMLIISFGVSEVNSQSNAVGDFVIIGPEKNGALLNVNKENGNLDAREVKLTNENGEYVIYTSAKKLDSLKNEIQVWTIYSDENLENRVMSIDASCTCYITTVIDDTTYYLDVANKKISKEITSSYIEYEDVTDEGKGYFYIREKEETGQYIDVESGYVTNGYTTYDSYKTSFVLARVDTKKFDTVEGVLLENTVVNLFDYWTTVQWPENGDFNEITKEISSSGINQNRALKFLKGDETSYGDLNLSHGGSNYLKIVKDRLGSDGYPVLNGEIVEYLSEDVTDSGSLAYLFNPKKNNDYKKSYTGVERLFQKSENGVYYYDCEENFAEFDEDKNEFTLYSVPGVLPSSAGAFGMFFPLNDFSEVETVQSNNSSINHYFGLEIISNFTQQYGGHLKSNEGEELYLNISGDDDIWIFVNGVLVADIGGMHNDNGVIINFSDGSIKYLYTGEDLSNGGARPEDTTIKEQFQVAGETDTYSWNDDTFADNTDLTMKIYYLERGNWDSDLSVETTIFEEKTAPDSEQDTPSKDLSNPKTDVQGKEMIILMTIIVIVLAILLYRLRKRKFV